MWVYSRLWKEQISGQKKVYVHQKSSQDYEHPSVYMCQASRLLILASCDLPPILQIPSYGMADYWSNFAIARGECLTVTLLMLLWWSFTTIAINDTSNIKTTFFGLHFCRRMYRCPMAPCHQVKPLLHAHNALLATEFGEITQTWLLLR